MKHFSRDFTGQKPLAEQVNAELQVDGLTRRKLPDIRKFLGCASFDRKLKYYSPEQDQRSTILSSRLSRVRRKMQKFKKMAEEGIEEPPDMRDRRGLLIRERPLGVREVLVFNGLTVLALLSAQI